MKFPWSKKKEIEVTKERNDPSVTKERNDPSALSNISYPAPYPTIFQNVFFPFDGEKTPYEMGTPLNFYLDYYSLRARSWESYIKSPIVQNAINKYCRWLIGSGLKFQSDPVESILLKAGIDLDINEFSEDIEDMFRLYCDSRNSVYNGMMNLHALGVEVLKNALMSGDCLCVLRTDGRKETMEAIDGYFIQQRINETDPNTIMGVKTDGKGKHLGFWIYKGFDDYEFIPAYGENTGRLQAWLVYGRRHKITDVRGMSLLTSILEQADKLERYADATLGAAEENAKIPITIEHQQFSTGENPLAGNLAQSVGKGKGVAPETQNWQTCDTYASKIAQTTNKQAMNLPNGASLKRHTGSTDSNFLPFFNANIDTIYPVLDMPPEVALEKYGGSFSGSRAALKGWEHTLSVNRVMVMTNYFYKPFFEFWFDMNVLRNQINAPGYLEAMNKGNYMLIDAYRKCRFIGVGVPHIDPVKEVDAERKKLGKTFDNAPLTTMEQAIETLNSGDFSQVIKKATNEKELSKDFNVISPVPTSNGDGTIPST